MLYKTQFAGRELKIETNFLASQASGAVLVSFGKTVVLGTAMMGNEDIEADFLPLTVDYEERFYAAGRISGSRYLRREGKPSEEATLLARMVDRAIRPYFPKNLRREVQIILTVFAFDEENDPEFPSLLAASLALLISNIPWDGPVAGVRVACEKDTNDFILNPTYNQREEAVLDLFISGIIDENNNVFFNMLDGEGKEISNEKVLEAIAFSKQSLTSLLFFQKEIQAKEGKPKISFKIEEETLESLTKKYFNQLRNLLISQKKEDKLAWSEKKGKLREELGIEDSTFEMILEKVLHQVVLKEGLRPDGRKIDEIRPITCQVGLFSQTHGSGLFCRGLTHVLSILTLAGPGQELLLEGMETVGTKRFLHHYNFPPYSSGEIKKIGSPGRREIGHGALAEKALRPLIPPKEEFPYTIRLVSEVLSSNGSTSMASVCASSLALFDGGVPIKRHIAGISCGLMMEENELKPISERDFKVLTDIQGPEDALGDMDLKIAGTSEGITAIQLDIKVKGLTLEILKEGFEKAKKARLEILEKMNQVLPNPRPQLSPLAPQILTIKINPEKIGEVIGTGGKMINEITEKTDASIDIEEDGTIFVTAKSKENAQKAIDWINSITREIQVGEVFQGKVKKIVDFGLFIELLPGREGLLHTSEIPGRQTKRILLQTFKVGQILPVKVKNIDETGRINLALLLETSSKKEANPQVKYGAFKKRFRR